MKNARRIWIAALVLTLILSGCVKQPEAEPVIVEEKPVEEIISMVTIGDNLLHMPVVNSGRRTDGSYDYSHIFAKLQPVFEEADIAVVGQETVFGGDELGYSGYPAFNSPSAMGDTLAEEGFDVVLHASNHILDKGVQGVEYALNFWDKYPEVTVLGINKTPEDKEKVDIMEVKGARLAMLNYTYGTNGLTVPAGKEYLVNYIDEEKIAKDVAYAEENADFTIVFVHWGEEYILAAQESQKALCDKMCEMGVDLVIGAHPHVIEPVEWYKADNGNKMLVYYSLGNFVSSQVNAENMLGGMADVDLCYNGDIVYIKNYSFVPTVTYFNSSYGDFSVYALSDYTEELAAAHRIGNATPARFNEILNKVFADYDMSVIAD